MKPKHEKYEGKVALELNKNGLINVKEVTMSQEISYQEKKSKKSDKKETEGSDEADKKEEFEMVDKVKTEISDIPFTVEKYFGLSDALITNYQNNE